MKITVFLTRECNLECKYCYIGEKENVSMSIETADKIIKFIDNKAKHPEYLRDNTIRVVLYGGEPLLNHEILKYIVEKLENKADYDVVFDMTTNGTMLNREILETLKKIHNVSVSIDGGNEVHDSNRLLKNGQGTFNIVKKNLEKMKSEGIRIRARGTYTSDTYKHLHDSIDNISKLNVECIVMHPDTSDKHWKNEYFEKIFYEIKKVDNDNSVKNRCKHISITDVSDIAYKKGSCFGGITDFAIDYNGNIYPCTMAVGEEEFLIGNVYNDFLDQDKIDYLSRLNIDNEICKGCSRIEYCDGNRCKIKNKLDTGDFFTPNGIMCKLEELEMKKYNYIKELKTKNDVLK